jgi:flagellar motor switch protein FliN/FliY
MDELSRCEPFLDIPLVVEAILDRKTLCVSDILSLEEGSVIKLNRSAGENIDIMIGGAHVAFAEVVIIEESMGVRVTDLTSDL